MGGGKRATVQRSSQISNGQQKPQNKRTGPQDRLQPAIYF